MKALHEYSTWTQWQPHEIQTLINLKTQGVTHEEIGRQIGRTTVAIKKRVEILREQNQLPPSNSNRKGKRQRRWKPHEEKTLQHLYEVEDKSVEEIARHFGLRPGQVQGKIGSMKLHRNYDYLVRRGLENNKKRWGTTPRQPIHPGEDTLIRYGTPLQVNMDDYLELDPEDFKLKYGLTWAEYNHIITIVTQGEWRLL